MRFSRSSAAALALALPLAAAQTSTSCDPTSQTCPNDQALNAGTFSSNFKAGKSSLTSWTAEEGTTINFGSNGAEFSIGQAGVAPTIYTDFYIFFGRISVTMLASPGTGIVSSIVLLSDDLDEIDWEFLGGNDSQVETNFFGKGNTTTYDRATYESVAAPQTTSHTYTIDWNSDRIEWIIDGKTVRTVTYDNSLTVYGKNYPQTPMRLKLGSWCGGCPGNSEGTIEWAGGAPNWNSGPFVMNVESVSIQNTNPGDEYEWIGESGSWQSIKVLNGGTTKNAGGGGTGGGSSPSGSGVTSGSVQPTQAPSYSVSSPTGNYTRSAASYGGSSQTITTTWTTTSGGVASGTPAGSSGAASASASSTPDLATGSAASVAVVTSYTLFALFCGFLLL